MFGVIMWSDPNTGSAVVWCECHAELAYFKPDTPSVASASKAASRVFDAGDLVEFDFCARVERRLQVQNLRATSDHSNDVLPAAVAARPAACSGAHAQPAERTPADIVDLRSRKPVLVEGAYLSRRG